MTAIDPFTVSDPLEAMPPAERVNYATGVLLDAEDFRAEQTYHRGRLASALRALAGFGTLAGLRVRAPAADDAELELRVEPGLAIDRHGRLVEVRGAQCIRLARWFAAQATGTLASAVRRAPRVEAMVDVFLSAEDCGRGKTPAFATGPFDALDAIVASRLAENARLELVPRAEAAPIPAPRNFWPAPDAAAEARLEAVLGSWEAGTRDSGEAGLDLLGEHVAGQDAASVFLARAGIPVVFAENPPAGTRPELDMTARVSVDNRPRPFVFLPGKWLGRAFATGSPVEP